MKLSVSVIRMIMRSKMFDNVSDAIKPVRKHDNRAGRAWTKPLSAILEPMEGVL